MKQSAEGRATQLVGLRDAIETTRRIAAQRDDARRERDELREVCAGIREAFGYDPDEPLDLTTFVASDLGRLKRQRVTALDVLRLLLHMIQINPIRDILSAEQAIKRAIEELEDESL